MIVHDLHVVGVSLKPDKTETPLIIDSNTVLPPPVPTECFQAISRWRCQVAQFRSTIQLTKLPAGNGLD